RNILNQLTGLLTIGEQCMRKDPDAKVCALEIDFQGTGLTRRVDRIDQRQAHIFLLLLIQMQISFAAFRRIHDRRAKLVEERWIPKECRIGSLYGKLPEANILPIGE